jgi:hypothetical protein
MEATREGGYTHLRYVSGMLVYFVFSQQPEIGLDWEACNAHARRFFALKLSGPAEGGRVTVTSLDGEEPPAERSVTARAATPEDHALALEAETRMGGGGLSMLARRCATLWIVERRREADPDVAALRIAAVLASVLLGPIVDPAGPEIFGVKTARLKLERAAASR